jgi:hypothetical protein
MPLQLDLNQYELNNKEQVSLVSVYDTLGFNMTLQLDLNLYELKNKEQVSLVSLYDTL